MRPGVRAEGARPWYEEAFGRGYLAVYPHRDLPAARLEARALVRQGLGGGRVLDLGCGFGRHVLALREAGVDAFGLDLSRELLEHALRLEGAPLVAGRLVRGDFRRPPFRAGAFEVVLLLFSSFGYLDDAGNEAVLGEVARVLAPGGRALLDLMNPERVRSRLVPESRAERGGFELRERRALADGGRRVVKEVRLSEAGAGERSWREDVRLYEPDELRRLARRAGLEVERLAGDFEESPFGPEAPRLLAWVRRP